MDRRVILVGGGLAGLFAALALVGKDQDFLLLERDSDRVEAAAGNAIFLQPCGVRAAAKVHPGLMEELLEHCQTFNAHDEGEYEFYPGNWKHFDLPLQKNPHFPGVHLRHATLRNMLKSRLPKENIIEECKVVECRQTSEQVEVTSADGTTYSGSALLDASGRRSVLRRQLFPNTLVQKSKILAIRGLFPGQLMELKALHQKHPSGHIVTVNQEGKVSDFIFHALNEPGQLAWWNLNLWNPSGKKLKLQERQQLLLELGRTQGGGTCPGYPPEVYRLLEFASQQSQLVSTYLSIVPSLSSWYQGRVALLGDAAHGFFPFTYAGTSLAFEDGQLLAELLSAPNLKTPTQAFQEYERQRKVRLSFFYQLMAFVFREVHRATPEEIRAWNLPPELILASSTPPSRAVLYEMLQ